MPTIWSCLLLLGLAALATRLTATHLYPFLAVRRPANRGLLVVEGWIGEPGIQRAVEIYRRGDYQRFVTTGSAIEPRAFDSGFGNYAALAAYVARKEGLPAAEVVAVPAPFSQRDRTWESAQAVRTWLEDAGLAVDALDVVSEGPHTRRSWELYRRAFADDDLRVGAIALRPSGYDPQAWWEASAGAKTVLSESIGWVFSRCCFRPEPRLAEAGIGVTIYSAYPRADRYYRLRRYGFAPFEIAPHPDGAVRCTGRREADVVPRPDTWYRFRLQALADPAGTRVRASVWPADEEEPASFQIDCVDGRRSLARGAPGLWAMGPGLKLWDDLEVQPLAADRSTAPPSYFEDFEGFEAGSDPPGWLDTGPDDSLAPAPGLFHTFVLRDGGVAFGTASPATNVHSHLLWQGSRAWGAYEVRGRLGLFDPDRARGDGTD